MRRASVVGKITRVFPVREYNKNGKSGKVASFMIGDETSSTRVTLWDVNHISLIEKKNLNEGDVVEIRGASVKNGEMQLSTFSDIKKSSESMGAVKEKVNVAAGCFKDATEGSSISTRAFIVQTFEPRYFDSKKKEGEKGVLLNVVLDDGTATMRSVMFGENIQKLFGVTHEDLFSLDLMNLKRAELIGEEKIFSGNFRMNSFSNAIEFSVNGISDFSVEDLVKEMEAIDNSAR
jgi:ssDNA-binding replication factor A large subunit